MYLLHLISTIDFLYVIYELYPDNNGNYIQHNVAQNYPHLFLDVYTLYNNFGLLSFHFVYDIYKLYTSAIKHQTIDGGYL